MTDSSPTTLYRLYAADGALLYVGIAGNPGRRFEQHRKDKPWWGDVATTHLQHFPTREEAMAAELEAIRTEHPTHNIVGRAGSALHTRSQRLQAEDGDACRWRCFDDSVDLDLLRMAARANLGIYSHRKPQRNAA